MLTRSTRDSFVVIGCEKDYYTVAETAEILGVSKATVQSYITNGLLSGVSLINGRRMVSKDGICQRLSKVGKSCIVSFFKEKGVLE
jgi:excisionase family DNA binding protein